MVDPGTFSDSVHSSVVRSFCVICDVATAGLAITVAAAVNLFLHRSDTHAVGSRYRSFLQRGNRGGG